MNTRFCLKNRLYACLKKCAYNVLCLPFIINANAPANAQSVLKRLTDSIEYRADRTYNISDAGGRTPFWLSSNRYGLGGVRITFRCLAEKNFFPFVPTSDTVCLPTERGKKRLQTRVAAIMPRMFCIIASQDF